MGYQANIDMKIEIILPPTLTIQIFIRLWNSFDRIQGVEEDASMRHKPATGKRKEDFVCQSCANTSVKETFNFLESGIASR